jgi:hypothetical protein
MFLAFGQMVDDFVVDLQQHNVVFINTKKKL